MNDYQKFLDTKRKTFIESGFELSESENINSYAGVVLDESSILKGRDGKMSSLILETFSKTPYKLACTATPSPNDHMELGQHSEFLGVCIWIRNYIEFININKQKI